MVAKLQNVIKYSVSTKIFHLGKKVENYYFNNNKSGVRVADKEIYVCRQHYNATLNPTETLAAVSS